MHIFWVDFFFKCREKQSCEFSNLETYESSLTQCCHGSEQNFHISIIAAFYSTWYWAVFNQIRQTLQCLVFIISHWVCVSEIRTFGFDGYILFLCVTVDYLKPNTHTLSNLFAHCKINAYTLFQALLNLFLLIKSFGFYALCLQKCS